MAVEVRNLQRKIKIRKKGLREAAEGTLLSERKEGDISIAVVNNRAIRKMNLKFRGVDSPTDVLAFSMQEGSFGGLSGDVLGDVVISAERALEQSAVFKEPFEREMARLSVHGTLHLLGYKDIKGPDRKKMKRRQESILKRLGALLGAAAFVLIFSLAASAQLQSAKQSRLLLGTVVDVQIWGPSQKISAALEEGFAECERIEALLSVYRQESELSQINRAGGGEVKVSGEVFNLIELSVRYGDYSNGAFDVTVGPLMKLWGFFRKEGHFPDEEELKRVRSLVDYRGICLDKKKSAVRLRKKGMELDLGGIAKGYAVDCMVRVLKKKGAQSGLVNAGGDIYAFGSRPGGRAWRVGIRHPRDKDSLLEAIQLRDEAAATSGDYENFFFIGKRRFSHIIDPRSGRPAQPALSVTVVAGSATEADFLSTALFVLGQTKGKKLLERFPGSRAAFVRARMHLPLTWTGHPAR